MDTKAVIEEITKDSLVILLGEEEKEIVIRKDQIPQSINYKVGDWLDVTVEDGNIKSISLNREETEKVKKRIEKKMEMLRKRMDSK